MGRADEVYRVLHRTRVLVRQVCEATAQVVEAWFGSDAASVAEETAVGKPRLVFAPLSWEEAEEATNELRDAIERSPSFSRIRAKTIYAVSRNQFRHELDGVHFEIQANPDEMDLEVLRGRANRT